MNGNFKDTRLIEAFDHIDPKYIAEVGESLKLRSVYTKEGEQKRFPFRTHLIQITALAACVLLLALAMPLFSHLPEIISSIAAGWGDESETSGEIESTSEYDLDIPPELKISQPREPGPVELTEAEMRRIAWAYIKNQTSLNEWLSYTYTVSCYAKSDGIYAVMIYCSGLFYTDAFYRHIVNGVEFVYSGGNRLRVYKDGELYSLDSAFEKGIIDEEYLLSIEWTKHAAFTYTQTSYPVELMTDEIMGIVQTYSYMHDTAGDKGLHYSVHCYGTFHSSEKHIYVVDLERDGYEYNDGTVREEVNGLVFEYPDGRAILVYPWDKYKFYSLTEAFESGMLTAEELKEVYEAYTASN